MKRKGWAFIKCLVLILGWKRSLPRKFRPLFLFNHLKKQVLVDITELYLNTLFIKGKRSEEVFDLLENVFPLSDHEREYLKEVLIILLPPTFKIKKRYEKDVELTHQLTYCFIKP